MNESHLAVSLQGAGQKADSGRDNCSLGVFAICFWELHRNTVELSSEVRASVTTPSGLGNRKMQEDTDVGAPEYCRCTADSPYVHHLMAVIKVDCNQHKSQHCLLVFGTERKPIIPRLVHRNPHALVSTMSSPGMEFVAAPEIIRELCRKLSSLRGLIPRDRDRGVAEDRSLRTHQSRSNFLSSQQR